MRQQRLPPPAARAAALRPRGPRRARGRRRTRHRPVWSQVGASLGVRNDDALAVARPACAEREGERVEDAGKRLVVEARRDASPGEVVTADLDLNTEAPPKLERRLSKGQAVENDAASRPLRPPIEIRLEGNRDRSGGIDASALALGHESRRRGCSVVVERYGTVRDDDVDATLLGIRAHDEARADVLYHGATRLHAERTRLVVHDIEVAF